MNDVPSEIIVDNWGGKDLPGQVCYIGRNIWLGNYDACNRHHKFFDKIVHIWHKKQPGICNQCHDNSGFSFEYLEHDSIKSDDLQRLFEYCEDRTQNADKLLIHCAAGLGRSPTLAILALASRGRNDNWIDASRRNLDCFGPMTNISRGMWQDYAIPSVPHFDPKVLKEIVTWCHGKYEQVSA